MPIRLAGARQSIDQIVVAQPHRFVRILALGVAIDFLDDRLRLDQIAVTVEVQPKIPFQRANLAMPDTEVGRNLMAFPVRGDRFEISLQDADMVPVGGFNLADLR